MLTTVMALGKKSIYLSCGHRVRNKGWNPMKVRVSQLFNCKMCDAGKPLHGKPMKETAMYKAQNLDKK